MVSVLSSSTESDLRGRCVLFRGRERERKRKKERERGRVSGNRGRSGDCVCFVCG